MYKTLEPVAATHSKRLVCAACEKTYPINQINTVASCSLCGVNPLLCQYDLQGVERESVDTNVRSMWRYFNLLPLFDRNNIVSLGEGWTPILPLRRMGASLGIDQLVLKDESSNPTDSFKARGMSMAISKAKELGIRKCMVPTAGNAGGAMAAYCARASMEAVVVMPEHTPASFRIECERFGAEVILIKGLISDCAKHAMKINEHGEYFDLSTLKEPYRIEGKKTMGYEIAEQLTWTLPDAILYPAGGGTGFIGMWKAFMEMREMGWLKGKLPRMFAVQAANCSPIVETWLGHQPNAKHYRGQPSVASGLAVPNPLGEPLVLKVIQASHGSAVAVSEEEIRTGELEFARKEGLMVGPEGAALWGGLKKLLALGEVQRDEQVLLLNTGSGYKYIW